MMRAFDGSAEIEDPKPTFFTDPGDQYDYDNFIANSPTVEGLHTNSGRVLVENPFSSKPILNPVTNQVGFSNPFQKGKVGVYQSRFNSAIDDTKFQPSSGSTTFVSQSGQSEKGKSSLYSILSLGEDYKASPNSTESKRLESARAQLVMRSYFKAFRIISMITLVVFLCPLLTTVMEITCVSSSTKCFPRCEIQTSKSLPYGGRYRLSNIFSTKGIRIASMESHKDNIITIASQLLQSFSEKILDSPIEVDKIYAKLAGIFHNSERVTFKIGHLGYCKWTDTHTFTKVQCHSLFENGFDLFSVFMKDVMYELSLEEIDGDAEVVSGIFVNAYKRFIEKQVITDVEFDQMVQFGYYSALLSKVMTGVCLSQFGLDVFALVLCGAVVYHLKNKTKAESIRRIKNAVGRSLSPVDQRKTTTSRLIYTLLTLANVCLIVALCMKVCTIAYEMWYLQRLEAIMNVLNVQVFEGVRMLGSGTSLDIVNCAVHIVIIALLTVVLVARPWVMKIVI